MRSTSQNLSREEKIARAREHAAYVHACNAAYAIANGAGYSWLATLIADLVDARAPERAAIDLVARERRSDRSVRRERRDQARDRAARRSTLEASLGARERLTTPERYAGGAPRSVRVNESSDLDASVVASAREAYDRELARERAIAWRAIEASLNARDRGLVRSALLSRAARIAATLRGEDPSRIAPVSPEHAIAVPEHAIASALHYMSAHDGASATAARFTAAIKASGQTARYADRPEHTGAIPTQRVRVCGTTRAAQPASGAPAPNPCTLASMVEDRRAGACRDLRNLIREHGRSRSRSARRSIQSKISAILYQWQDDAIVRETARSLGWRAV